ncbi:MAG: hypothetical protein NC548_33630 [Lachnospiraceae bacterium]|nr:hypothetical protein [Lachnospiraceae bacterium]
MKWANDFYNIALWVSENTVIVVLAILILVLIICGLGFMVTKKDKRSALVEWLVGGIFVGAFLSLSAVGIANTIVDKLSTF